MEILNLILAIIGLIFNAFIFIIDIVFNEFNPFSNSTVSQPISKMFLLEFFFKISLPLYTCLDQEASVGKGFIIYLIIMYTIFIIHGYMYFSSYNLWIKYQQYLSKGILLILSCAGFVNAVKKLFAYLLLVY